MTRIETTRLEFNWRELTYLRLALDEYRHYIGLRMKTREDQTPLHPEDWYDMITIDWLLRKTDPENPAAGDS